MKTISYRSTAILPNTYTGILHRDSVHIVGSALPGNRGERLRETIIFAFLWIQRQKVRV